jgi:hypothetical protein
MISRFPALRTIRTASATGVVLLLLLMSVGRGDDISGLRLAAGDHEQDLVRWEITHFMDKWFSRATDLLLPGTPDDAERLAAVEEFFDLRDALAAAQRNVEQTLAAADAGSPTPLAAQNAQATVDTIEQRRRELQGVVEETLEAAISQVAHEQGILGGIGALRWPPVDFTFEDRGLVLVRSPRDRIVRLDDLLLDPGVSLLEQGALEDEIEAQDGNTSALVVRIGGVATYPAQVSPTRSLHSTLELASHEWLHHWLIFKPLGRRWFAGGELQSINETVANIFGQEIGDLALEAITGVPYERAPWMPPIVREREEPAPGVFDFTREMRETRTRLEEFLEAERVDEAEAYLEERRLAFVANGYPLRKLNNAWFAFNGTYAGSAASISPIEGQLRAIRADSADLAEFLDRVGGITEVGQLAELALAAGWAPIDTATGLPL